MSRRFGVQQWREWLDEIDQRGISVEQFAAEIGIGKNSVYYWRRKLRQGAQTADFIPVTLPNFEEVTVRFPCGATAAVPATEPTLRSVFKALMQADAGTQQ